ncbi:hypothetical protein [Anoxynatronum buryatiense]|uniref:hypothetical protein n=1 Tax=Anoxynatronum buryatiense TaxID=489973 RepID=UPI0024B85D87|nr:hypothetical protein [Anoxynatronum buryatiense]
MRYFRNVMKSLPLIGVVTVIMVLSMFLSVIRTFQPAYEASTSLLVSRNPGDDEAYEAYVMLQEVQIAEKIVNDIPELIFSTRVRQAVNRALQQELGDGNSYDEETFLKSVETETVLNARVVHVAVRYPDAEGARVAADTVAWTIDQMVMDLTGQDFIHVIRTAERPDRIAGLGKKHLWVLGLLGGVLLGMAIVLLMTLVEVEPMSRMRNQRYRERDKKPSTDD